MEEIDSNQTKAIPAVNAPKDDEIAITSQKTDTPDDNEADFKYHTCKYCKGIIPKHVKKNSSLTHCSKVCSETNKMVPNELNDFAEIKGKDWSYYREVIKEKAAPTSIFFQITEHVEGLEPGMKLEVIDICNPINFCVATVIKVVGHRLCVRYDGFGDDDVNDFWCNFQAEELFPIGWCARYGYPLQPPQGIVSTSAEWKAFLTRTLMGALAAPMDLFKKVGLRRQLRCHPYLHGTKVEIIHPKRPDLIVPATITKSLGPYYFLVSNDHLPGLPPCTFYGYADCPNVYPLGWCESRGLELVIPPKDSSQDFKMVKKRDNLVEMTSHGGKRNKLNPLKLSHKVEALDGKVVRVATVAEVFGRVAMLVFDGTNKRKFIDKCSTDVFPIGWSQRTESVLVTPYGPVNFQKEAKHKKCSEDINSASFSSFQNSDMAIPLQYGTVPGYEERFVPVLPATSSQPQSSLAQTTSRSSTPSTLVKKEKTGSDANTDDIAGTDMDLDVPFSPKSPLNSEKQKNEMEKFVVWLLNNFEYTSNDTQCVVKPDLVDNFVNSTNIKLSPRWFALIYKLFPGVSTVRRSIDGKFVNGIRHLRETRKEKRGNQIFVKDAVNFVQSEGLPVLLHEDKLVIYMGIGDNYTLPEDTQDLFETCKAKKNSNILVISSTVSTVDFLVSNFSFSFEVSSCAPPLQSINTMDEFCASVKLSQYAKVCRGVQLVAKADNTQPNFRYGKVVRNGRLYSSACNILAFPHKGDVCLHCKNIRCNKAPGLSSTPASSQETEAQKGVDRPKEKNNEANPSKEEEDNLPSPDIKIYFNKSCNPGIYLDPVKVAQMKEVTQLDRPAQVLKYLIERLIEVSLSKEKLLEIIEAGFGVRIFNKAKDKVVKKGLFRFNTRRKVMRFLRRLMKRLNCCEFFLSIDRKDCAVNCKKLSGSKISNKVAGACTSVGTSVFLPPPQQSPIAAAPKLPPGTVLNTLPNPGNLQVLYQLPVGSTPKPPTPGTPRIVVQQPAESSNMNIQNRFPHGTQFFLPSSSNNLTYMVVTKESAVNAPRSPIITDASQHHAQTVVTSPPSGVTQMMANVAKTNLVSDIDEPTKSDRPPAISIVKGSGKSNQQIFVKKSIPYDSADRHYNHILEGENTRHPAHGNNIFVKKSIPYDSADRHYNHNLEGENTRQPVHDNNTFSLSSSNSDNPPSYQDATRSYAAPYPRAQSINSYGGDHRDSSRSTIDKSQQIHVHKVHHGNARVKYVEFKPVQDGGHIKQQGVHSPHGYTSKQTLYYQSHVPLNQSNQHLSVHAPGQSPRSPLHSPPALRPPPVMPSRSVALSSPPSLVPSPGFEFVNSSMQQTNLTNSAVNHSPVQVTNQAKTIQGGKSFHLVGNQNITLPRIQPTYQVAQHNQMNMIPRSKTTAYQMVHASAPDSPGTPTLQGRIPGVNSTTTATTTVTVTMTYIPIPTSTKDKLVYVPVNSLQSGQGQPVVLYQHNQQIKDTNGNPVLIPQHLIQNMAEKNDTTKEPFTTARIQGLQQGNYSNSCTPTTPTPVPLRTFRYQFGSNMSQNNFPKSQNHVVQNAVKEESVVNVKREEGGDHVKMENQGEIMTIISNQLRMVPQNVGIHQQASSTPHGVKRNNLGLPAVSRSYSGVQSPSVGSSPMTPTCQDDENMEEVKVKKRRGRPPSAKQDQSARSKLSMMQVNPLAASHSGNPITLVNRVLTETFYKKQQQLQNRVNFLHEPLLKLPNLSANPELWSSDDVYKFLCETDCAAYANLLRDEEIDGKSFMLMTREALMEFTGIKLGPALKISGHAAYLRARHRMQTVPSNGLQQHPLTTKERKNDAKKERKIHAKTKTEAKVTPAKNTSPKNDLPLTENDVVAGAENMDACDSTLPELVGLIGQKDERENTAAICEQKIDKKITAVEESAKYSCDYQVETTVPDNNISTTKPLEDEKHSEEDTPALFNATIVGKNDSNGGSTPLLSITSANAGGHYTNL